MRRCFGQSNISWYYCFINFFLEKNIQEVIQNTKVKNLDVIGSNVNLSGLEVETANDTNRAFALKQIFEKEKNLLSKYDNVFIDCPHR